MLRTYLGKGDVSRNMLDLTRVTGLDAEANLLPGGLGENRFLLRLRRIPKPLGEIAPGFCIQSHGGGEQVLDGRCHVGEITGRVKQAQGAISFQRRHEARPDVAVMR